jgi:hypothetical protein
VAGRWPGPSRSNVAGEGEMADVWFVLVTVALFVLIGLVVKGVERL